MSPDQLREYLRRTAGAHAPGDAATAYARDTFPDLMRALGYDELHAPDAETQRLVRHWLARGYQACLSSGEAEGAGVLTRRGNLSGWSLEGAILLCREIERQVAPTWHVALAGSVLLRGESTNDLDVHIYPHRDVGGPIVPGALVPFLDRAGLKRIFTFDKVQAHWRKAGSDDEKVVEIYADARGRLVDVFFTR